MTVTNTSGCTCGTIINGVHGMGCAYNGFGSHSHTYGTSTYTIPNITIANPTRDAPTDPAFDDPKVEKRWAQLRGFDLELPSNNLNRDLEEKKRVLLQRGVHLREVIAAPDMGEGIVQFIAATEGVKRDGNTLLNSGWEFNNFSKNPVFLFQHDYSQLPIGQHVQWKVDGPAGNQVLRVWSRFVTADIYPFAERVRMMYEKGFLRAVSIGWIPLEYEPVRNADEIQTGWLFKRNELLEVSAVSVPADPDAIIQGVNQRILEPSDIEVMATYVDSIRAYRNICHIVSNINGAVSAVRTEEVEPVQEAVIEATPEVVETEVTPEPVVDPVITNETPTEEIQAEGLEPEVFDRNYILGQIHQRIQLLTSGKYLLDADSRNNYYNELTDNCNKIELEVPTFDMLNEIRQVREQLYGRKVMDLNKYEKASTEDLLSALMYQGELMPDVLTDVLNTVRDAVDTINDTLELRGGFDRAGSKVSKETYGKLNKAKEHMNTAAEHIAEVMSGCNTNMNSADEPEVPEVPEVASVIEDTAGSDIVEELTRKLESLTRAVSNEPEPVPAPPTPTEDELMTRVADLKKLVIDDNADKISATTKSTYVRDLLKKIMDSEQ